MMNTDILLLNGRGVLKCQSCYLKKYTKSLSHWVEDCDPDFMPFVVVSSETDHLPIGIEALNWSDEALIRREPELKQAREWAMETVSAACGSLVTRFADA
jgi:hypothetical protein